MIHDPHVAIAELERQNQILMDLIENTRDIYKIQGERIEKLQDDVFLLQRQVHDLRARK